MPEIEKGKVRKAIQELRQLYEGLPLEPLVWTQDGNKRDPYRVLIVMGLSQQTSDEKGIRVLKRVLSRYPSADGLIEAWHGRQDEVLSIVKPLGNHGRARQILDAAVWFGNSIPATVAPLRLRPGIGETTAEKIVGYGYGKPALPLDSHGCRIVSRICDLEFDDPPQNHSYLRKQLKKVFQAPDWIEVHELLRLHGMIVCRKRNPACGDCPVSVCAFRREVSNQNRHAPSSVKSTAELVVGSWDRWRQLLIHR